MATVNLGRIKFVWQGAYNGATAYVADDVVSYNGSSYICILASTGNLPTNTTYWNQMSQAGTNGTNGTDVGTVITTQGDLLYRDASGLQRLGAGTSGQFLKTNGSGANPQWSTISAGITEADTWRVTTTFTSNSGVFNANWERVDTSGYTVLGTGMTEASGVFSFPSTGYYSIDFKTYGYTSNSAYAIVYLQMTLNNSTFDGVGLGVDSGNTGGNTYVGGQLFHIVKITDIVNQKIRFFHTSSNAVTFENDTSNSQTQAQFIKLAGL